MINCCSIQPTACPTRDNHGKSRVLYVGRVSRPPLSDNDSIACMMVMVRTRIGWLADALDASEQALYNFDMAPVHEAYSQMIEDNQDPTSGDVPFVVPSPVGKGGKHCNDIAWTSA